MTPHQISLVQKTWSLAEPLGDTVTTLFYGRLFELDPSLRALFKTDMQHQGRSLRVMISMVTVGLSQVDKLIPTLVSCGRRHVAYGVADSQYDTVREALLWTLAQGLRQHFTAEVREAWSATYELMAGVMKEAAAKEVAAQAA
ncbi:MAG TPA: globin family protein [Novimethylophilus sp.]|jgi:hemoglobin-like flavoprotein|uniref:globin family protein n=1 Tax=Novimethylophilus sp. TaxID=2137426 RepID=UPI002F4112C8